MQWLAQVPAESDPLQAAPGDENVADGVRLRLGRPSPLRSDRRRATRRDEVEDEQPLLLVQRGARLAPFTGRDPTEQRRRGSPIAGASLLVTPTATRRLRVRCWPCPQPPTQDTTTRDRFRKPTEESEEISKGDHPRAVPTNVVSILALSDLQIERSKPYCRALLSTWLGRHSGRRSNS